ncbi:MAG: TetR/AcrR family transcriptional regulator [Betaproteobacteria bacterium]|nr:TetR/AcrR family transcriptional regulator [Betaproteobacteria bacterium]PWB63454.1 MAG: TetR family transcriptional regulator [Betaproteobacteria bacterium]
MSPQALKARKGEETRAQILDAAVQQASEAGFESLTIGSLAERTGLSKSGLFAHFGSRTDLQIAVLDEAARRFTEAVFLPAFKAPRGLKRLRALFENWITWPEHAHLRGGCPMHAASAEYDDQPGPMRDAVVERQRLVARELAKAVKMAVDTGDLRADTDPGQFVFEMFGLILAFYHTQRLLGDDAAVSRAIAGFDRLVDAHRAHAAKSASRPAAARR